MPGLGVILGLCAALSQSFSYVFSRRFVIAEHRSPVKLLVLSHTLMGFVALSLLPGLWTSEAMHVTHYFWALLGASGSYMIGQAALFVALRRTDASRISPLLGLKVVMVALIWMFYVGKAVTAIQWGAVILSVAAAFILNYSGGTLPLSIIGATLFTCFFYAVSDVFIIDLVKALSSDALRGGMLGACMAYIVCGSIALLLLPRFGSTRKRDWIAAVPFSTGWFASMILFFSCLAIAGPVLGNIVLATRGLFSIALGAALAQFGLVHLEKAVSRDVLRRRAIAAALMIAAIALYKLGDAV